MIHELQGPGQVRSLEAGEHLIRLQLIPKKLYFLAFGSVDTNAQFTQSFLDSLMKGRESDYGLTFLMTLSPRVDTLSPVDFRNDVIYGGISGFSDYRKAFNEYSFGLKEKIWLESGGKRYPLRNSNMTQSWGLTKSRVFTLMFDNPETYVAAGDHNVTLVVKNLVPGQGIDRFNWKVEE